MRAFAGAPRLPAQQAGKATGAKRSYPQGENMAMAKEVIVYSNVG